jgi:hypothetical protein
LQGRAFKNGSTVEFKRSHVISWRANTSGGAFFHATSICYISVSFPVSGRSQREVAVENFSIFNNGAHVRGTLFDGRRVRNLSLHVSPWVATFSAFAQYLRADATDER